MGGSLVSRRSPRAVCLLRALFHSCFCSRSPGAKAQSTAGPKECALAEGTPLPCPGMYFLKNVFELCWPFVADGFSLAEASRASLAVQCGHLTAAAARCSSWAWLLCSMRHLPRSAIEPVSLALEGEFFSTETPGTPLACILINRLALSAEAAECHPCKQSQDNSHSTWPSLTWPTS